MRVSQLTAESNSKSAGVHGSMCPYGTVTSNFCSASVMTVVMSSYQKITYCWTDDYDRCPLFLAKVLRGN